MVAVLYAIWTLTPSLLGFQIERLPSRKEISRLTWPGALWSAPAERSVDGAFNRAWSNGNQQTDESGVALRLPPHSKVTKKGQAIAWPFCFKERRLIVASPHKSEQQVKNRDKNVE